LSSANSFFHVGWILFGLDLALRLGFGARIVRRRLPAGVSWAWLSLILFIPIGGTLLYLLLGEYRQSRRRQKRLKDAEKYIERIARERVQPEATLNLGPYSHLARAYFTLFGLPAQMGNDIELLPDAAHCFKQLIHDVDQATTAVDCEFYIWSDGGDADLFGEALMRAVQRGVTVRLLVDAIGSSAFLRGKDAKKMRNAGVKIGIALPSGFWRSLFARPDLRVHRKIAVIDGAIAYTGSLNLADPKLFKASAGVGQWVDALARIQGPAVGALYSVFLSDWCAETGEDFAQAAERFSLKNTATGRKAIIQTLPSGPAVKDSTIEQALIMAINCARQELTLTTPYFVPSDALRYALIAAAQRGVRTTLIVPRKVDSHLTHYASRSFLQDLLAAGVAIGLFRNGLLHTKSVTVDREFSLFGSLNLDPRSLRINFEITAAVYDSAFAEALCALQASYWAKSDVYSQADIDRQSALEVWKYDLARLVGPLL
jgi:cardiolipin synthase